MSNRDILTEGALTPHIKTHVWCVGIGWSVECVPKGRSIYPQKLRKLLSNSVIRWFNKISATRYVLPGWQYLIRLFEVEASNQVSPVSVPECWHGSSTAARPTARPRNSWAFSPPGLPLTCSTVWWHTPTRLRRKGRRYIIKRHTRHYQKSLLLSSWERR